MCVFICLFGLLVVGLVLFDFDSGFLALGAGVLVGKLR